MNKAQVNPDLDEVKRWKKVLLNLIIRAIVSSC